MNKMKNYSKMWLIPLLPDASPPMFVPNGSGVLDPKENKKIHFTDYSKYE